ncbi:DUF2141 domain-containing protein [Paraglaciecola sp. 2405UD69-4]|uniref:DUF2141 domain-containing protein n=1 Tax=Paraglaciecola sp. 2405UD69-4 TaxID=3391836 RepID=UPI0039C8EB44
MMKTAILVTQIILSNLAIGLFSLPALGVDLALQVMNKKPQSGTLFVELYKPSSVAEEHDEWQHIESVSTHTFKIVEAQKKHVFSLSGLAIGTTCIRAFLDVNANERLDRSPMGVPKEPVAFANNPPLFLGEPVPAKGCFELTEEQQQLVLKLQQKKRKKA